MRRSTVLSLVVVLFEAEGGGRRAGWGVGANEKNRKRKKRESL